MSPHINYDPKPRYFNVGKMPIVGKSCSLVDVLFDCQDQITIGDYVSFGHDVQLLTAYHDYTLRGKARQETSYTAPIVIGNGVWIASRVTICAGVVIDDDAVIGAGSIVTPNTIIGRNELWVGNPAQILRYV